MAFLDTTTQGEAFKKAVAIGATYYYQLMGGYKNQEVCALWFFRDNKPLSLEEAKQINKSVINLSSDPFLELAHYCTSMLSFEEYTRINGLVNIDQLKPIDNYYFNCKM